jgi:hypothetical protein
MIFFIRGDEREKKKSRTNLKNTQNILKSDRVEKIKILREIFFVKIILIFFDEFKI